MARRLLLVVVHVLSWQQCVAIRYSEADEADRGELLVRHSEGDRTILSPSAQDEYEIPEELKAAIEKIGLSSDVVDKLAHAVLGRPIPSKEENSGSKHKDKGKEKEKEEESEGGKDEEKKEKHQEMENDDEDEDEDEDEDKDGAAGLAGKRPEKAGVDEKICGVGSSKEIPKFVCTQEDRRAECKPENSTIDHGCGRNQVRCDGDQFESSNIKKGKFIPCCEKENLLKILEFVDRTLCGKVEYSIMFGTLLAAVREQDLIDWDTDIDVIAHDSDRKTLEELFTKAPEEFFIKLAGKSSAPMRVYWGEVNQIHADVYFLEEKENNTCAHVYPDSRWIKKKWFTKPFRGKCIIQNRTFPCPVDAFKILDSLYGDSKPGEDGPSWRRRTAGNDKEHKRECHSASECTVKDHGFSCEGPDPDEGSNSSLFDLLDSLLDEHDELAAQQKLWIPHEPKWAADIRKGAKSLRQYDFALSAGHL